MPLGCVSLLSIEFMGCWKNNMQFLGVLENISDARTEKFPGKGIPTTAQLLYYRPG